MWADAKRFWGRSPWRSAGLLMGCALVAALVVVNAFLLRSSVWFVPAGVQTKGSFATLGAYSAEGRFSAASAADLRGVESLGFRGRYSLYGEDLLDASFSGRRWKNVDVAFVSDEFFELLDVRMAQGSPFGVARSGLVVDHEFWRTHLASDPSILGKSLGVADSSLPIVGVLGAAFHGLGHRHTDIWIPARLRSTFLQIGIQGTSGVDLAAIKASIAEELPAYQALVALDSPGERALLDAWRVKTLESVSLAVPAGDGSGSTTLNVGFNRRDFRPAILTGINLVPAETQAIQRYLWLLSGLSGILALLAVLNLGSFWSARTTERSQEIQVRHAVGATVRDLIRLFAGEALPFLAFVLLLAIPLAWSEMFVLRRLEPFHSYLRHRHPSLGPGDFALSLGVLALIGCVAVAAPLLNVFQSSLRSRSMGVSASVRRLRLGMMAGQWILVAGVTLVAGASFLSGSRMQRVGWGGERNPYLIRLPWSDSQGQLLHALKLDAARLAAVETEPLGTLSEKYDSYVPDLERGVRRLALYRNRWTPTAFSHLGVPLRAGHVYEEGSEAQAMVSESYARALGLSAEGLLNRSLQQIGPDGKELPPRTIVGVVGDVHYSDLRTAPEMVVYLPPEPGRTPPVLLLQESEHWRISAAVAQAGALEEEVVESLTQIRTMEELRDERSRTESLLAFSTFGYALLALSLLLVGLLAEARMQLAHRGREMALVVSLGASLENAVLNFLRTPLIAALVGLALVLPMALSTRVRWMSPFPLLRLDDVWALEIGVLLIVGAFGLALTSLSVLRLRNLSLAELLRVER